MNNKVLVIPIDFSDITENALKYALKMSNSDDKLILLHIEGELNKEFTKNEMETLINKYQEECKGELSYKIVEGKVNKDIDKIAQTLDASLIVMGTRGASKLEKYFGSNAIQVISSSKTPFIVVQSETYFKPISKIAMTIDLDKESVQIVKIARRLCQYFNSELILIGGEHSDPILKKNVRTNMTIAMSHFKEHGLKCSFELLDRKNFLKDLINFCDKNEIGMLAATYYPENFQILSKKFVQQLFNNELKMPVLTVDAESVSSGSKYSFISV